MPIVPILLFALCSNMDNFVVGLSYGVKKIHIPLNSNIVIGLTTTAGTTLAMLAGKSLLPVMPVIVARILGSLVIIAIGLYYVLKYIIKRTSNHKEDTDFSKFDKDKSSNIELREAFTLGLALTANNIGLGVSASITGLNILEASAASLAFSLLFLYFGNLCGKSWVSRFLGKYSEPVAGVLIVLLGIYELF